MADAVLAWAPVIFALLGTLSGALLYSLVAAFKSGAIPKQLQTLERDLESLRTRFDKGSSRWSEDLGRLQRHIGEIDITQARQDEWMRSADESRRMARAELDRIWETLNVR